MRVEWIVVGIEIEVECADIVVNIDHVIEFVVGEFLISALQVINVVGGVLFVVVDAGVDEVDVVLLHIEIGHVEMVNVVAEGCVGMIVVNMGSYS